MAHQKAERIGELDVPLALTSFHLQLVLQRLSEKLSHP